MFTKLISLFSIFLIGCTHSTAMVTNRLTVECSKEVLTITNPSQLVLATKYICTPEGYIDHN